MADIRPIKVVSDVATWFASEEGKNYRGASADMNPILKRVRYLDAKVNGAGKRDNPLGWGYIGSYSPLMIQDWARKNHYTLDQIARNEDGARDKFKRYLMGNQFNKLRAH